MAKLVTDIKDFMAKARRKDVKNIKIKKVGKETKFKIRCSRFLYTLKVSDKEKADKLLASLPAGITKKEIK